MKLQTLIHNIEEKQFKKQLPTICIGDTIKIRLIIQEAKKQRIQPYEGTVIAQHHANISTTITVRRVFQNIGIERVFALHSPLIENIEILRCAKIKKAKLYYLRSRVGKSTRLKERFN